MAIRFEGDGGTGKTKYTGPDKATNAYAARYAAQAKAAQTTPAARPAQLPNWNNGVARPAQFPYRDQGRNTQTTPPITQQPDRQQQAASNAWAQRYQAQADAAKARGTFGVDYGPNWTRSSYVPPVNLRMGEYAPMQMTQQEYVLRRQAQQNMLGTNANFWQNEQERVLRQNVADRLSPSYDAWLRYAAATPNEPHWIGSAWANANPMPRDYMYVPYGPTYVRMPQQSNPTQQAQSGGAGSGYRGYSDWGGYGGGGGYDWTPRETLPEWYMNLGMWRI